jgi:hypothetical protein
VIKRERDLEGSEGREGTRERRERRDVREEEGNREKGKIN